MPAGLDRAGWALQALPRLLAEHLSANRIAAGARPGELCRQQASSAATHEIENLAAKLLVRGVEGEDLREVIVLLEPPEARAGTVARAQCREQFGSDDIEAGIVVFGDDVKSIKYCRFFNVLFLTFKAR